MYSFKVLALYQAGEELFDLRLILTLRNSFSTKPKPTKLQFSVLSYFLFRIILQKHFFCH